MTYADAARGAHATDSPDLPVELFGPSGGLSAWVTGWCTRMSATSSRIYNQVLPHSPALRLEAAPREEWIKSPIFRWVTPSGLAGPAVPLEWSSRTEQRWASLAVEFALYPNQDSILILDEPEEGLHRTAEAHAATALIGLVAKTGAATVIASHSPAFLNDRRVTVIRLNRAGASRGRCHRCSTLTTATVQT